MSGSVTTIPSWQWTSAPTDLINALNIMALPIARIDEITVTDREMVAADVQTIAGSVPPLARDTYTTGGAPISVPHLSTVTLTTAFGFAGGCAIGDFFVPSQPVSTVVLEAECLVTNLVTIKARNIHITVDQSVPASTAIQIIKASP